MQAKNRTITKIDPDPEFYLAHQTAESFNIGMKDSEEPFCGAFCSHKINACN